MPTVLRKQPLIATNVDNVPIPPSKAPRSAEPASINPAIGLLVTALCGLAFGFALHKSNVFRADLIRDQFRFTSFTMLKTFLSAAATSMLAITLLYHLQNPTIRAIGESSRTSSGLLSVLVGGFLLGTGMAFSGSCPGTIWAQLGAGSAMSLVTLGAAVAAAVVYGFTHTLVDPLRNMWVVESKSVHDMLPMGRTWSGVTMAALLFGIVALLGHVEESPAMLSSSLGAAVWSPVVGGIIIGGLQLPLLLLQGKNLGCSSSFVALGSTLVHGGSSTYFHPYKSSVANWWQVILVACAALGSYLALVTSADATPYDVADSDVSLWHGALGGFLIVVGARIAGGCTSGHGITGMGHMSLRSIVAVAAMFVGGIVATNFLL